MVDYIPNRGDIVWLSFNPQTGNEQSGHRPAIVLSPDTYNQKTGLALFCPITSRSKGYPFETVLPDGLQTKGAILSDHIKSLDWKSRNANFIEKIPESVVNDVFRKVSVLLKMDNKLPM